MKSTEWVIVWVGTTGQKTASDIRYNDYDIACEMMEILEQQNKYSAFLIYTVEEWEQEKADYGWQ